jgi:hypothetical protein
MEKEFLEKFESNINELLLSPISFKTKLDKITWFFTREVEYWDKKAEDGIISKLKIFSSQAVDLVVNKEIALILKSSEDFEKRKKLLEEVKITVSKIAWLPVGFKSSINLRLSFASIK